MSIRLVVSDVDGTLVGSDKSLAPSTAAAAAKLRQAGVMLCLVSARPPRGLRWLQSALKLDGPVAGFNGGMIVGPAGTVLAEHFAAEPAARSALGLFAARGVQSWVYSGDDWFALSADAPHVAHESRTIGYGPKTVDSFEPYAARVSKLVGVSDDADLLGAVEAELQTLIGDAATAKRSQRYYLDLTAQEANKGAAVRALAVMQGVRPEEVAVLGDMANDVPMFEAAGFSVAMGNATDEVKASASASTGDNDSDGWAQAVEALILPKAAAKAER